MFSASDRCGKSSRSGNSAMAALETDGKTQLAKTNHFTHIANRTEPGEKSRYWKRWWGVAGATWLSLNTGYGKNDKKHIRAQ